METILTPEEQKNKRRGWMTSTVIHIFILILLLIPFFTYQDPPPGQEGILVNLGMPDLGQGEDNAGPSKQAEQSVAEPEQVEEEQPEPQKEEPVVDPEPIEEEQPTKTQDQEVITAEDPEQIALKKKQEEEARKKAQAEAERKKKAEAEARKKAQAEAERKKKAEEAERKRKEAEAKAKALKDQLAGGFAGSGEGKGNTGKPGNQGAENGDPNASNLEGVSSGIGKISGGLGRRGIVSVPKLRDDSQDAGKVAVEVCVDASGRVVSASITQRGTTTVSSSLRNKALAHAKTIKFKSGPESKICGIVPYTFKVK